MMSRCGPARPALLLLALLLGALAACKNKSALGPADAYVLLAPKQPPQKSPAGNPIVEKMDLDKGTAVAVTRLLSDGFAVEMVRTVHLAKQDMSFGHTDAVKLENVEALDATGYGANNVQLSIDDVLNMTDGDNRLTIVGESGDSVTLTANGNDHWTVVESNAQFTTYAYSDPSMQAVVEISNQLNAQVS